jgi:DHA1 family multidrug resistance protein-like MFS transporter
MNIGKIKKVIFSPVGVLFFIYFIQGIVVNLGHPVTPAFVKNLNIPDDYFGYYFAAMSFGMLVGAPLWGTLADISQKRYYLLIGLLLYSVGQILFGYGTDKNIMIIYRFMSGFGVSASITLLMSHLIEHSPKNMRKMYLGWSQGLMILGSSLGYFIGGRLSVDAFFIAQFHTDEYRNIFLLQGIVTSVLACFVFFVIKENKQEVIEKKTEKRNIFKSFTDIKLLNIDLLLFLVSLTFISLGAIVVSKFIEVYMSDSGLNPSDIGEFVGATGIVSLITMIVVVPFIVKIKNDFKVMIAIQLLSAITIFFVFRQADIVVALYTGFMFYVVLKTVYAPLEQHYIAGFAEGEKYGSILGVRQSFYAVGLVIGPLIGGILYNVVPLYAFDFSVSMFLIGFILLLIVGKRLKNQEN